jgi:hypothetical protein
MNRINISEGLSIFPCKIIKIAIQKNKKDSRPAAESLAIDVLKLPVCMASLSMFLKTIKKQ